MEWRYCSTHYKDANSWNGSASVEVAPSSRNESWKHSVSTGQRWTVAAAPSWRSSMQCSSTHISERAGADLSCVTLAIQQRGHAVPGATTVSEPTSKCRREKPPQAERRVIGQRWKGARVSQAPGDRTTWFSKRPTACYSSASAHYVA